MKIQISHKVEDRILKMAQDRTQNISIMAGILYPITAGLAYDDRNGLERAAYTFQRRMEGGGFHYSFDQSLIGSVLIGVIAQQQLQQQIPPVIMDTMITESRVFHEGELESDPFLTDIKVPQVSQGDYTLTNTRYLKYDVFQYDEAQDYQSIYIPRIGVCDHRYSFPCMKVGGRVQMAVTPFKISTCRAPLEKAQGRVLILGLDLGYFAYLASRRENVSSITIVEKSGDALDLFRQHILPQFANADKIELIQEDPLSYMKEAQDGAFDFCFVDFWDGDHDAADYLRLKQVCRRFQKTALAWRMENTLVQSLEGYAATAVMNEYAKESGKGTAPENADVSDDERFKKEFIEKLLENAVITVPEQIDALMDTGRLIEMIS